MTEHERYKIMGYLIMLQDALPNGRYIHSVKNKITFLRLKLQVDTPISEQGEIEIKRLIRLLYP